MRLMGLESIYPKPRLSTPHPEQQVFPDLLRGVPITGSNQVWCSDITYIRLRQGFLYLVAIMDWYSRYVLSWSPSPTLDVEFCMEDLDRAFHIGKMSPVLFCIQKYTIFNPRPARELKNEIRFIGKDCQTSLHLFHNSVERVEDTVCTEFSRSSCHRISVGFSSGE